MLGKGNRDGRLGIYVIGAIFNPLAAVLSCRPLDPPRQLLDRLARAGPAALPGGARPVVFIERTIGTGFARHLPGNSILSEFEFCRF